MPDDTYFERGPMVQRGGKHHSPGPIRGGSGYAAPRIGDRENIETAASGPAERVEEIDVPVVDVDASGRLESTPEE